MRVTIDLRPGVSSPLCEIVVNYGTGVARGVGWGGGGGQGPCPKQNV